MRFDTWLTLSGSEMDLNSISNPTSPGADFGGRLGHPTVFASVRDPEGRFLLRYPEGWACRTGPSLEVRSKRLPLFARVDVLAGTDVSWEAFRAAVAGGGGLLIGEKRLPGPPRQIRGQVVANEGLLNVRALAYPSNGIVVVLTTGMVPALNPDLERYGLAVLAAVRREFSVPAPGPSV